MKILGIKTAMSQVPQKYVMVPVTIIDITENVIAKKFEHDGEKYVLVGFGKKKKPTKPEKGQFKELGYVPLKTIQVKVNNDLFDTFKVGDKLTFEKLSELFPKGEKVDVTGISKGKGFAGVIKRWGFSRQPKTHGQSDRERHPGAIGAQTPGRVLKGKKMPGRMGNQKVTVKNLEIVDYLQDEKEGKVYILLKGSVPGAYKRLIIIKNKIGEE